MDNYLHLHKIDVGTFYGLSFTMPPSEVGRGDIEISVEYSEPKSGYTTYNAWARIGDSLMKGFIHTGEVMTSDDVETCIIESLNDSPKFADTLKAYIAHITMG